MPNNVEPAKGEKNSNFRRKEDKLREIWLKDREKRKGKPKKVKLSLRRKLLLIIILLILSLLGFVYRMTLTDEEQVLREELMKRGGTVARNLADSIYNSYGDIVQTKGDTTELNTPSDFAPLQFSDAMKKASEQQDFITGYAINEKNQAFVHSSKQGYLIPQKTPKGIFDFKTIYPIKLYLESILEKKKILLTGLVINNGNNKLFSELLNIKNKIELLDKKDEALNLSLITKNDSIFLKTASKTRTSEIDLKITDKDLKKLIIATLNIIKYEYQQDQVFIKNQISEFRKIRRSSKNSQDKKALKSVIVNLDNFLQKEHVKKTEIINFMPKFKSLLEQIRNKKTKNKSIKLQKNIKTYLTRFRPFIQIYNKQTSEKLSERILYISYPMCETDKYFTTYRGEVHLLLSQKGITYTINYAKEKLQLAALFAIIAGTIFTIIMAFFITNPIKKLMYAMHKVGAGDLNQTVLVRVSDEIGVLADNFNEMTEGLREKERIRSAMNKAVSKDIAEVMLSGDLKLGGDKKEITVLFSDIRSFTTISESLSPEEVVEMLNEYMTIMTNIVVKHKGNVDKFVGDEIMALWGAPKSYGNDAISAVKAALEMMEELDKFNERRTSAGLMPIDIGIGLNTGEVIAGNMGSEDRLNYTVIGDNVNLGARLEGTNKMYQTHIIISEYTYNHVKEYIYSRELDLIKVKGKNDPVSIYEVMGLTNEGEKIRTTSE